VVSDAEADASSVGCGDASSHDKEGYVGELLTSFAKTWRQYAKLADTSSSSNRPVAPSPLSESENRQKVVDELVQSASDAFVATRLKLAVESNRTEAIALSAFAQLLLTRIQEIGGPAAVEQAIAKSEAKVLELQHQRSISSAATNVRPSSAPLTPEHRPASASSGIVVPPAPLASYASGSDTDRATSHSEPDVVRNAGTSDTATNYCAPKEEGAREKRDRLELRARTAFQIKMGVADPPSDRDILTQQFAAVLQKTAMDKLEDELNQNPPLLDRLPAALGAVADALVEALPKRLRGKVGREIQDVLDWSNVRRHVSRSEQYIVELMTYIISRVRELGAPAREAPLQEQCEALQRRLNLREEPLGTIVVAMLQFMLDAIRQLRQDISSFTLAMISNELSQHAETYHDEFLRDCLPDPADWTRTIDFFRYYNGKEFESDISRLLQPPTSDDLRLGATALTDNEQRLRAVLFVGTMDLLRSANKSQEQRWNHFAAEAFVIEKNFLFQCANDIQKHTLRLFVSGTVSMLLHPKRPKAVPLADLLKHLDTQLCNEWLQRSGTLIQLQQSIREEINSFLCVEGHCEGAASLLSESEVGVLDGMLAKLTDVMAPQYAAFESRVMRAVESAVLMNPLKVATVQRTKTAGVVSESTFTLGSTIRRVLDYHWTVMRERYVAIQNALLATTQPFDQANQDTTASTHFMLSRS